MRKSVLAAMLFAPIAGLLFWVLFLALSQIGMQEVKVQIMGYDPRDLIAGRYLAYQIDWDKTDCGQFENGVCPKEEFCVEATWGRQCRFYVAEAKAHMLDLHFMHRKPDDVFEVIYKYKKGRTPIAKKLLINGKDWRRVPLELRSDIK